MRYSDAVRRLARGLSLLAGVEVTAEYDGPRSRDGQYGGWTLWWSAGPGRDEMRELARTRVAELTALVELDRIRWYRTLGTEEQAAAAVLAWMVEHPESAADALVVDDDALPVHPDQLPASTRRRAATLAAAGWRHHCAGAVERELVAYAGRGWPAVAEWLDALGDEQDAVVLPLRRR